MDDRILINPFGHAKRSISRVRSDLQDSFGTKYAAEHFQRAALQRPRNHTRTEQFHMSVTVQLRQHGRLGIAMLENIIFNAHVGSIEILKGR